MFGENATLDNLKSLAISEIPGALEGDFSWALKKRRVPA
jgi:hypothetical protein